ncbi:hypothetical protein TWF788_006162 [Orbilia oligospora]|uniref:Uncharacterized protein n=1 Tax=Orbilia oligospora TaxID=2813651 RepID=A0A7C8Q3P7_ORBOL|nr:hypothetical protein TWF788_006162 [Orbilia oligospora]
MYSTTELNNKGQLEAQYVSVPDAEGIYVYPNIGHILIQYGFFQSLWGVRKDAMKLFEVIDFPRPLRKMARTTSTVHVKFPTSTPIEDYLPRLKKALCRLPSLVYLRIINPYIENITGDLINLACDIPFLRTIDIQAKDMAMPQFLAICKNLNMKLPSMADSFYLDLFRLASPRIITGIQLLKRSLPVPHAGNDYSNPNRLLVSGLNVGIVPRHPEIVKLVEVARSFTARYLRQRRVIIDVWALEYIFLDWTTSLEPMTVKTQCVGHYIIDTDAEVIYQSEYFLLPSDQKVPLLQHTCI